MRVDLPEPFSPTRQWTSPACTDQSIASSAMVPPNFLPIFSRPRNGELEGRAVVDLEAGGDPGMEWSRLDQFRQLIYSPRIDIQHLVRPHDGRIDFHLCRSNPWNVHPVARRLSLRQEITDLHHC